MGGYTASCCPLSLPRRWFHRPNQLHSQDLLRWSGKESKDGGESGAGTTPPTHSQLSTTHRHSHPFGAMWSREMRWAEISLEGGPREGVHSPGAPT